MITGTAKLVVDLGNSETRVKTIYGKTAKGNVRERLSIIDNRYSIVPDEKLDLYLKGDTYSSESSYVFERNGIYYCNGDVCNIEMAQTSFRPTALEKKYESKVTLFTLINAFRQGIEDVAIFSNCDSDNVGVDWEVYLLLPPEDLEAGSQAIASMVKSIEDINFLMPELYKKISISKVKVFPEGMCAFFGVLFSSKGIVRKGYDYLMNPVESTVIFDIGAGTTDIVMIRGSQIVQSSRFTKEIGGNNVHRLVQRSLRNKGISLPDEVVREGVNTGYVKSGSRSIDIAEEIASAKQAVSNQLVDAVQEFFESSMISIRTISNILVCGGGAEIAPNKEIKPISDYIVNYMKRLSPDIKLVKIPEDEEGNPVSSRLLNINGAGILAE